MKALIFPGQGTQFPGMGKDLFDAYRDIVQRASEILGKDIKEVCASKELLSKTRYSQPAIYLVNALTFLEKYSHEKWEMAMGHSLGEYNALHAAQAFSVLDGFKIVKKRGELMDTAPDGAMAAIVGLTQKELEEHLKRHGDASIEVANYNAPTQFVLSGPKVSLDRFINDSQVSAIPLNVAKGFHSSQMKVIEAPFREFLDQFTFLSPQFPVIANVNAKPYTQELTKELLVSQLCGSVKWIKSVEYALDSGVKQFFEVNSGILTKMVNQIEKGYVPKKQEKATSQGGFCEEVGVEYNLVSGSMYRGVASVDLVSAMANSGFLSFFGSGGMTLDKVKESIGQIKDRVKSDKVFGVNFLFNYRKPEEQFQMADLLIDEGVKCVEASAFMDISIPLAYYIVKGLYRSSDGTIKSDHKVFAKVSRPAMARLFMSPIDDSILDELVKLGKINGEQRAFARSYPAARFISLELDSGGHTDQGALVALLPSMFYEREKIENEKGKDYPKIFLGLAGGFGDPYGIALGLKSGVDYIQTGSVNLCTVESGMSDDAKDLLFTMEASDTAYAPAGDMFEIGAKVQVLKKGVLFPARASKLYYVYALHNAIDEIPSRLKSQLEEQIFKATMEDILDEALNYFTTKGRMEEVENAHRSKKHALSLVCRWYLSGSTHWAMRGDVDRRADYQIHVGPALGAFNRFVKGSQFEDWRSRHIAEISKHLFDESQQLVGRI